MLSVYNDHLKNNLARYLARIKAKVRAYLLTYLLELEYFPYRTIRDFFSLIPYSVYNLEFRYRVYFETAHI